MSLMLGVIGPLAVTALLLGVAVPSATSSAPAASPANTLARLS